MPEEIFYVKDCSLASIATGIKTQTLSGLRDRLATIHPGCIYFHFWGGRLRTSYEHREYHNDFSYWVNHALHDQILAERLEILDPTEFKNLEDLRLEIIELIENRLDEVEVIPLAKVNEQFHFIRSKIIVFKTREEIRNPPDLVHVLPKLTNSSFFFHFIDAATRTEDHRDDFTQWLKTFGEKYSDLITEIRSLDPYFISLAELKHKTVEMVTKYFLEEQNDKQPS